MGVRLFHASAARRQGARRRHIAAAMAVRGWGRGGLCHTSRPLDIWQLISSFKCGLWSGRAQGAGKKTERSAFICSEEKEKLVQ
jgi:hypothetical protein